MSKFRFQSGVFFYCHHEIFSLSTEKQEKKHHTTRHHRCVFGRWSLFIKFNLRGRVGEALDVTEENDVTKNSKTAQRVHHEPWDNIHIYLPSQNVILWWKRRGWIDFLSYSATSMELLWFYDNIRFNRWEKSMENESRLTENILTEFLC